MTTLFDHIADINNTYLETRMPNRIANQPVAELSANLDHAIRKLVAINAMRQQYREQVAAADHVYQQRARLFADIVINNLQRLGISPDADEAHLSHPQSGTVIAIALDRLGGNAERAVDCVRVVPATDLSYLDKEIEQ